MVEHHRTGSPLAVCVCGAASGQSSEASTSTEGSISIGQASTSDAASTGELDNSIGTADSRAASTGEIEMTIGADDTGKAGARCAGTELAWTGDMWRLEGVASGERDRAPVWELDGKAS